MTKQDNIDDVAYGVYSSLLDMLAKNCDFEQVGFEKIVLMAFAVNIPEGSNFYGRETCGNADAVVEMKTRISTIVKWVRLFGERFGKETKEFWKPPFRFHAKNFGGHLGNIVANHLLTMDQHYIQQGDPTENLRLFHSYLEDLNAAIGLPEDFFFEYAAAVQKEHKRLMALGDRSDIGIMDAFIDDCSNFGVCI